MTKPVITQEDIEWVRDSFDLYSDSIVEQMQYVVDDVIPEGQRTAPYQKIIYEVRALRYLLDSIERCAQQGKPIPKIRAAIR